MNQHGCFWRTENIEGLNLFRPYALIWSDIIPLTSMKLKLFVYCEISHFTNYLFRFVSISMNVNFKPSFERSFKSKIILKLLKKNIRSKEVVWSCTNSGLFQFIFWGLFDNGYCFIYLYWFRLSFFFPFGLMSWKTTS